MDKKTEKRLRDRAYWLGEARDAKALPELLELLHAPSAQVRRLSVSALGKLAGLVPVEEVGVRCRILMNSAQHIVNI
jgi:HEAT repeat protein